MIHWCAYCQQFQGEAPPFERWEVSHGICENCATSFLKEGDGLIEGWTTEREARVKYVVDINARFWLAGKQGNSAQIEELAREGLREGIRPIDLLFGFAGPAMVRVGVLWASNELTVRDEHRFTECVEALVDFVSRQIESQSDLLTGADNHTVLLANIPSNEHTLGLRFVKLGLASMGVKSFLLPPELSADGILEQALSSKHSVVGLSISMPSQTAELRATLDAFLAEPAFEGRILIGGAAVNMERVCVNLPPNAQFAARLRFHEDEKAIWFQ